MSDRDTLQRTYHYPGRLRWSYLTAALCALGLAGAALALQFTPRDLVERGQLLIFAAVFLALSAHFGAAWRLMRRPVQLHRDGIIIARELAPWASLREVQLEPFRRAMHIVDDPGRTVLTLHAGLEAFGDVADYIIEHMHPRIARVPCELPLLSQAPGALFLLALSLIAVWFGPRESGLPAALLLLVMAALWARQRRRARRLWLRPDALELRQGRRTVLVHYRDIAGVQLDTVRERGTIARYVVLRRHDGPPLEIGGFRNGYRAAFLAIGTAWTEATSAPATTGATLE